MTASRPPRPGLLPFTPLYRLALAFREIRLRRGWESIRRLNFPVISIGNLSTGGTGKTPFAIALARLLTEHGYEVNVLSRGYGRKSHAPARVNPEGPAEQFGDEPLLIARDLGVPVYVARERYQAGLLAERDASQSPGRLPVHILDDGFQHRQLHRDVNILLLNRDDWRDRLLPAGNLREPLTAAARADVIAIPESEPELERELRNSGLHAPVWRLRRRVELPAVNGPAVAFCGIARPQQFFTGLQASGLRLADRIVFPDHHPYTPSDLARIQSRAHAASATALVTTAKDVIRLAPLLAAVRVEFPLLTAGLTIEIEAADAAMHWLNQRISRRPAVPAV